MRDYTPRGYQSIAQDFMLSVPRCNLWLPPGLGKTSVVLTILDFMHNDWGESAPTLVLGPLRVARDTWTSEVAKWSHLSRLEVVSVTGDAKECDAALRTPAQVYVTNYDRIVWVRDWFKARGIPWPFARVIADESTRLKGFRLRQGTVRAQALAAFAHREVKAWANLTGTPASNGLKDLWGQQWFIDSGRRLGRTYSAFEERWFMRKPKHPNDQYGALLPMPGADTEIHERLSDCSLYIDPKAWFDLREPIVSTIEVELPPAARTKYRALERQLFALLDTGEELEVFSAASLSGKCLQLANGCVYLDPERYGDKASAVIHDAKIEALDSLIEELAGAPMIVAYQFRTDLTRLHKAFPEGVDLAEAEGLAAFKAGQARIGFGHPQSIGHGIDGLQNVCNVIVFFGQDWNLEVHDQIIERIGPVRQMQAGLDRPVFIYYIVARDTVDEVVMARRTSKRGVQDLLLDYMKAKT